MLMKPAIERQPVPDFLATRFVIAAIILILVRPSVLSNITPRVWWTGGVAGVVLSVGYVAQTIGLHYATAAITGFLTGLYVVGTPLLAWLLFRQPVNRKVIIAAVLGLTGLGIISLNSFGVGVGEIWIIVGALFFALHIVVLGRWAPGNDSYALTVVQIIVVAIFTAVLTFADGDGYVAPPDADVGDGVATAGRRRHRGGRDRSRVPSANVGAVQNGLVSGRDNPHRRGPLGRGPLGRGRPRNARRSHHHRRVHHDCGNADCGVALASKAGEG